ncbi:hypothetical protein DFP91_4440 [Pseudorhodoplanes sinuspersici]|nr:hypothetical protein DFP91_4440 [Pseudorhodoplanes sinuspersici]
MRGLGPLGKDEDVFRYRGDESSAEPGFEETKSNTAKQS